MTPLEKTIGKVTNPRTSKHYSVQCIAVKDAATSILGAAVSQTMNLLKVQFENIAVDLLKVQFENIAVLKSASSNSQHIYTDMTNQLTKTDLSRSILLSLKDLLVNYQKHYTYR